MTPFLSKIIFLIHRIQVMAAERVHVRVKCLLSLLKLTTRYYVATVCHTYEGKEKLVCFQLCPN